MNEGVTRDYGHFDSYLDRTIQDVYAQPPDAGHTAWARHAVVTMTSILRGARTVLDVGCGQGFLSKLFEGLGYEWTGVTIGEDYDACVEHGLRVDNADMTFLRYKDKSFDVVFARHVLEHSPFPLLTLMEWRRVCKGWLILVAPSPGYWGIRGRNHYSIMNSDQLRWLLSRAGWRVIHRYDFTSADQLAKDHLEGVPDDPAVIIEYRLLCEQCEPEVT